MLSACVAAFSPVAIAENATASASVQITLRLLPRVEVHSAVPGGAGEQLCLQRIPADHYQVLVWSTGSNVPDTKTGTELQGNGGSHCLSPGVTAAAEGILIVAQ